MKHDYNCVAFLILTLLFETSFAAINQKEFANCDHNVTCFGLPDNCISSSSCEILVKSYPLKRRKYLHFQLIAVISPGSWAAVGLSEDDRMGSDSVTDCLVLANASVKMQQSFNMANIRGNLLVDRVEGITSTGRREYKDGNAYCSWRRRRETLVEGVKFDLNSNLYYVLLAKGDYQTEGQFFQKAYHSSKSVSSQVLDFEGMLTGRDREPGPATESEPEEERLPEVPSARGAHSSVNMLSYNLFSNVFVLFLSSVVLYV